MDITLARTFLEQVSFIKGTRRKNSRRWPRGNTRQPKKDKSNKNKTESLNDAKQLLIPLEKGEIDKTMPMIKTLGCKNKRHPTRLCINLLNNNRRENAFSNEGS